MTDPDDLDDLNEPDDLDDLPNQNHAPFASLSTFTQDVHCHLKIHSHYPKVKVTSLQKDTNLLSVFRMNSPLLGVCVP